MTYCIRDMRYIRLILAIILVVILLSTYCICMSDFGISAESGVDVLILMYHNIIKDSERPNKYEISISKLEDDMRYIRNKGYETILPSDLIAYQEGKRTLPNKAVMLTFDDGYISYIDYLLPLLERYDMRAVVSVVGEYTALNKDRHDLPRRYTYVDYDDIKTLHDSGRVAIGYHSYGYHHIGKGKNGASQMKGESYVDYKKRLLADTNKLKGKLASIGITTNIYTYPYGAYSKGSDEILRETGVKCTLSCSEGINHITRTSKLYLLRRYNRSGIDGSLASKYSFFREK